MSYVHSNLMPNEHVIAIGKAHWWGYVPGFLFILLSVFAAVSALTSRSLSAAAFVAAIFLVCGVFSLLQYWIYSFSTELAVTNKRVIAKFGFIRRSTIELLHKNVESFHVEQGVLGRILDFGTLVINGTGGIRTPIPSISSPLHFRRAALGVIEG